MSDTHAETVAFVRTTMLPEAEPPITERGALKWMRENLFSSWLNVILTVLSLLVIAWVLWSILPWFLNGIWDARSTADCQDVREALGRDRVHGGACWAVIEDRWLQLLFGFYPAELYWRPILAVVLLGVAMAPVLYADRLPSRLLGFSALYPFIAVWLIWGGSFWGPLIALAGFVLGFAVYRGVSRVVFAGAAVAAGIVAAAAWWISLGPMVGDAINRAVAETRYEETLAEAEVLTESLPAEIEAAEAEVDRLAAEITEVEAERDAVLHQIRLIQSTPELEALRQDLAAAEARLAALDSPEGFRAANIRGEIERLEEAIAELQDLREGESIPPAERLDALRDELLSYQERLAELSDEIFAARAVDNALTERRSDARQTVRLLTQLPEREASIPGIEEEIAEARAVVPDAREARAAAAAAFEDAWEPYLAEVVAHYGPSPDPDDPDAEWTEREAINRPAQDEAAPADLRAASEEIRAMRNARNDAQRAFEAAEQALSDARDNLVSARSAVRDTYADIALTGLRPVDTRAIGGFMLAVLIGMSGIVLSFPLGIVLALARQSDLVVLRGSAVVFIETIRGVPLIVWLFTASTLLNYFLPPGTEFDLILRVTIMVTLFASAYMAEVIRGGLAALPRGQYEGADSLGLDYWQSMRLIILPQALKISIPGIVNTFIGLFKDTTLVQFIGLLDPLGLATSIRASEWIGIYWELFIFIGLCFFVFCFGMSRYSQNLERRLATDRR